MIAMLLRKKNKGRRETKRREIKQDKRAKQGKGETEGRRKRNRTDDNNNHNNQKSMTSQRENRMK